MSPEGKLVVISGPSGVGKSTVCAELLKKPGYVQVVTCTTRLPRPGEIEGRHYHFMSRDDFEEQLARGRFLEHAVVHGNLYGTPKDSVERQLREGQNVLLSIDVKGAAQLRALPWASKQMVTIFIMPPNETVLRERLLNRGTEDAARLALRLDTARKEMLEKDAYDHVVVNEDLARTVDEVLRRVQSHSRNTHEHCSIDT